MLSPGEEDDRAVMAAIEASKREESALGMRDEDDPEILEAITESRCKANQSSGAFL